MAQPRLSPAYLPKQPRKYRAGAAGGGSGCRTPRDFLTRLHNSQADRVPVAVFARPEGKSRPGRRNIDRIWTSVRTRSATARRTETHILTWTLSTIRSRGGRSD